MTKHSNKTLALLSIQIAKQGFLSGRGPIEATKNLGMALRFAAINYMNQVLVRDNYSSYLHEISVLAMVDVRDKRSSIKEYIAILNTVAMEGSNERAARKNPRPSYAEAMN